MDPDVEAESSREKNFLTALLQLIDISRLKQSNDQTQAKGSKQSRRKVDG